MNHGRYRLTFVLLVGVMLLVAGGPVAAGVPSPADTQAVPAGHLDPVAARAVVANLLRAHGLSDDQVQQRLADLSDEDVVQLSQHADQIQEGGGPPEYIWILLGIFLAVAILTKIL